MTKTAGMSVVFLFHREAGFFLMTARKISALSDGLREVFGISEIKLTIDYFARFFLKIPGPVLWP